MQYELALDFLSNFISIHTVDIKSAMFPQYILYSNCIPSFLKLKPFFRSLLTHLHSHGLQMPAAMELPMGKRQTI